MITEICVILPSIHSLLPVNQSELWTTTKPIQEKNLTTLADEGVKGAGVVAGMSSTYETIKQTNVDLLAKPFISAC